MKAMQQKERERLAEKHDTNDIDYIPLKPQDEAHKISDETAAMLDEIDDLLEENAQAFVEAFVQVSGQ